MKITHNRIQELPIQAIKAHTRRDSGRYRLRTADFSCEPTMCRKREPENDPEPSAKLAQDLDESKHPRDERGRFADLASRPRQSEQKFKPELYVTWVAGSADLSYIIANVLRAWRTRRGRRSYACSIWIPEVWMVKNVKSLSAEL
jgi:hypothetical protein